MEHHRYRPECHAQEHERFDARALNHSRLDGRRGDDQHNGQGQERQASLERREPERQLQEVGEEQKHREDAGPGHEERGERSPARAVPHDVQRHQRVLDAALDQNECAQQHGAGDERDDGGRGAPPVRLGIREAEHECKQTQ
jgi:hypothetical protein